MNDTFMKEKPILPLLTSMAFPMVISMLVGSLYNIVDSFFVAQISEKAMTALSLVFPVQNFINAVSIGYGIGINALIAFSLGAGNKSKASLTATQGLLFSAIHGILIMAVCIPVMPAFLRLFTSDDTVIALGVRYSAIAFLFSPIIMVGLSFEKIFQSVGRMKIAMISMLCGCISNIILDPLLIFGIGFFPEMGISGAAIATGISFLNAILSMYSQSYVVILGIYYKLQTFLYLPANGIVQGMRPLIGYNFGAGEHGRVKKIYNMTLCMSGIIMLLGTVACLTSAGQLIGLFTDNPETILAGQTALRIISAGFIVSAVSVTSSGALEGLGKGTRSLIISLFRYLFIIIPAAAFLCRAMGPVGVWNAFWITEFITAVIAVIVYRKSVDAAGSGLTGRQGKRKAVVPQ